MFLHPVVEVLLLAAVILPAAALVRFAWDRWRRRKMYRVLRDIRRILEDDPPSPAG